MSRLLFTWFVRQLTIYNCPIESSMSIGQGNSYSDIEVWKHSDPYNKKTFRVSGEGFRDEINNFITNGELQSDELVDLFITAFGCVPLYNNGHKYCGMQFNSFNDYLKLRKPIPCIELLGVTLPKAYVMNMGMIQRMCADLSFREMSILDASKIQEITLEHFPDYLRPHLKRALTELGTGDGHYMVEDAAVYDYLEIIDVLFGGLKFIDGEELVDVTPRNMLQCGHSYESATVINTEPLIAFHIPHDASLLTDNIIKYSHTYTSMVRQFPKPDSIDIAAMRLFLRVHGKN